MEYSISNLLFILFILWPLVSRLLGKNKQNKKGKPTSDEQISLAQEESFNEQQSNSITDRVLKWNDLLKDVNSLSEPQQPQVKLDTVDNTSIKLHSETKLPNKRKSEFKLPGTVHIKPLEPEKVDISSKLTMDLSNSEELKKVFIYKEIFDKPLALRKR